MGKLSQIALVCAGAAAVYLAASAYRLRQRMDAAARQLAVAASQARFETSMIEGLPDLVRRYFQHSMEAGAPLPESVTVSMTGLIRLSRNGAWMPMQANEILTPGRGFLFQAAVGKRVKMHGSDLYVNGRGAMDWRLFGVVPIVRAGGPDISRSALGRMAGECFLVPGALLPRNGVQWRQTGENTAQATFEAGGHAFTVTLRIAANGALEHLTVNRWGNVETPGGGFEELIFGGQVDNARKFGPYTIPTRLAVGWRPESPGYFEFFQAEITAADFQAAGNMQ